MIKRDQTISSRVTGVELTKALVKLAADKGLRIYMLGGKDGVADEARMRLEEEIGKPAKGFKIKANAGPQKLDEAKRSERDQLVAEINSFKPNILLVALGHKRQEKWLWENKARLNFDIGVGVGGSFDYISGRVRRAPKAMRAVGLEWLFRLIMEPWRWKRQLKLIKFMWLVVKG